MWYIIGTVLLVEVVIMDYEYTDTHFYIVFKQSREYLKLAEIEEKVGEKAEGILKKNWSG